MFGKVSEGEAPVSEKAWDNISANLPKPGFWQFGWQHMNVFYLTLPILIASGVWVLISYTGYNEEKQRAEKPVTTTSVSSVRDNDTNPPTEKFDVFQQEKDRRENKLNQVVETEPESTKEKQAIENEKADLQDKVSSEENIESENSVPSSLATASAPEAEINVKEDIKDSVNYNVDPPVQDTAEVEPADSAKTPAGKKIIVFEEDTIVQVDTVYKDQKRRKKRK